MISSSDPCDGVRCGCPQSSCFISSFQALSYVCTIWLLRFNQEPLSAAPLSATQLTATLFKTPLLSQLWPFPPLKAPLLIQLRHSDTFQNTAHLKPFMRKSIPIYIAARCFLQTIRFFMLLPHQSIKKQVGLVPSNCVDRTNNEG